jgi:hypothetical protein
MWWRGVQAAAGFIFWLGLYASHALAAPSEDLATEARRAAALLASHQQTPGYWLTTHTPSPNFERPLSEMNTFLTAMIADLLAPVTGADGLGPNMSRARQHLSSQIEDTGLVRYHGRPDIPVSQRTSCVITPDADDTALTWRIAPAADRTLLQRALATLDQYRRPDGLYRTWLAPRDQFQCIDDTGGDPNPADAVIQMHLFMFLAQAKPPESRALCAALQKTITEDRIWVYYEVAPLIPILRQADVAKAGCPLVIPPGRLKPTVPGQDTWIAAGTALSRLVVKNGGRPAASEIMALLRQLAQDDFAEIRRSPPLLYHNDMTARNSRFYWSEDFGYALWLRLHFETLHRG